MTKNSTSPDSTLLWDSLDLEPLECFHRENLCSCAVVTNNSSDT